MIAAILLIPTEGDPHGLLREGPCGARPPVVQRVEHRHQSTEDVRGCIECDGAWPCAFAGELAGAPYWSHHGSGWPTRALVLAWDGEPVAEVQPYIERAGIDYGLLAPFVTHALAGMDIGQGPWPGDLVLLDAEGREVSDE